MNELTAFILGLAFKAIATATVGNMFSKLADYIVKNIRDWPTVLHYVENHGGKSFACLQCKFRHAINVDTIGENPINHPW